MFTIRPGMRLCPVGTSLTAGGLATGQPRGWWCDLFGIGGKLNAGVGSGGVVNPLSTVSLHPASLNPPVAVHFPSLAEIGGAKLSDLLAAWSTLVTQFEPIDGFILEGNINDVHFATDQTTFRTEVQTMLGLTGSRPVLWLGALLGFLGTGEDSTTFGDAFNTSLESYNTIVAQEIANIGSRGTYVDGRTPLKARELVINPTHLGQGILCTDGVHLTEWGIGEATVAARPYVQWSTS